MIPIELPYRASPYQEKQTIDFTRSPPPTCSAFRARSGKSTILEALPSRRRRTDG